MDRGYANFQIESTQVAIAPEKDDMYITVNVTRATFQGVRKSSSPAPMVVPESQMRALRSSSPATSSRAGRDHFAGTDELPPRSRRLRVCQDRSGAHADNDKKTVSLTFFIEPGNRVYVRTSISTTSPPSTTRRCAARCGNSRRWLSNSAIERSKERLQRLPYVEKVESRTSRSPAARIWWNVD